MDGSLLPPGIHLILGGQRSGKSDYAEALALDTRRPVVYVATYLARTDDPEMGKRIEKHKNSRDPRVKTVENRLDLLEIALEHPGSSLILDCLTLWLSAQTLKKSHDDVLSHLKTSLLESKHLVRWHIVSSEIGLGVIPPHRETREFLDLAGSAHKLIGSLADRVDLMVAGIPLKVK